MLETAKQVVGVDDEGSCGQTRKVRISGHGKLKKKFLNNDYDLVDDD